MKRMMDYTLRLNNLSLMLCKFIQEKLSSDFQVPLFLDSATDDVVALPNKYWHLTSFYKFGCGACASRTRNKWYNICDECKQEALKDDEVIKKVDWFTTRVNELMPMLKDNDEVSSDDDEWKCDECEIIFPEVKDLKSHINEYHPGSEIKFKRGKSNSKKSQDGKATRRKKEDPQ